MKKRVVITGMGVISPIGNNQQEYWDSLVAGKSGAGVIQRFDTTDYGCHVAAEVKNFNAENYISEKKRIRRMDLFTQYALAAMKEAMEDSKLDLAKENLERIGVIAGCGVGGLWTLEEEHSALMNKGPRRVSPFLIPKFISNIAPGEMAITYGLRGINYCVTSACASSANAIGDALRLLRYGDADVIVTGGTEAPITHLGLSGFANIGALSSRDCDPKKVSCPFDKKRDGFLMAEGAGIIVLETLEHAQARGAKIYAELIGYGASDDAYHITAPDPQADSAVRAMKRAIEDGNISPDDIDYINAHGTSTPLNDKIETMAIKRVLGDRAYKIPVSSTKSIAGHLLGAAGAVELIACVLIMQNDFVHPTINLEDPDPECDLDYVPNQGRKMKINCALSNSLGFGGHNAVLVVRRFNG